MHKQNKDCRKQDKFKTVYIDCRAGPECQNQGAKMAIRRAPKYGPLNLLMWHFFFFLQKMSKNGFALERLVLKKLSSVGGLVDG